MKLTEKEVLAAQKGYPQPVTEKNFNQAWAALKVEMECSKFAKRTGLPRNQVTIVVNRRAGCAYPQWIGAVPKEMKKL